MERISQTSNQKHLSTASTRDDVRRMQQALEGSDGSLHARLHHMQRVRIGSTYLSTIVRVIPAHTDENSNPLKRGE